jgi:hypothetical protein
MTDLPALIASAGVVTGVGAAFAALLRANLLKDKLFAEHMKEMLEATKAGARADYAVASALQRLEQKVGVPPSGAGSPQPTPPAAPGQAGQP